MKLPNGLYASVLRTVTPMAISFIAATNLDEHLPVGTSTLLVEALAMLIAVVYYIGVRIAEKKYPLLGKLLLGSSKAPIYSTDAEIVPMTREEYDETVKDEVYQGLDDVFAELTANEAVSGD